MKQLELKSRPTQTVPLKVPLDALAQLQQIADARKLGLHSLLKLYIGEGLRSDVSLLKKKKRAAE